MDYYPFGMLVPSRHGSAESYRYGFQGQEKDDELKGEGNSYDFGERLLDPRIGRWSSTDNVEKPWLSPYQFAANNPVNNIDPDGNDEIHFYYRTQQMYDKDGNGFTQLILSSEIIKNNSEHTFFMHAPQGVTTQFHPFKSDRTQNTGSRSAYDAKLPLSKGLSWFGGLFELGVDDAAYLGTLLQVAPEVMEHYRDISQDGARFQGAVDMAGSVDFAEKLITAEETVYAIVDGYYLVEGLSKFAIKSLAKNSVRISPSMIKFSQSSVNGTEEIIASMKSNGWKGDAIDVVAMKNGDLITIDNTRVLSAHEAGIEVEAVIRNYDEPLPQNMIERFTTKKGVPKTWGEAIDLRIQKQNATYRNSNPSGSFQIDGGLKN